MGKPTWTQWETDMLLRAWEAAVPSPRARELTPSELGEVFKRFRAVVGGARCTTTAVVDRMVRQIVATHQFITAFNERSRRLGNNKSWFEMPHEDRAKCIDGLPTDSLVIKFVSRDFFEEITRICSDDSSTASNRRFTGQSGATEEGQDVGVEQEGGTSDWEPGNDAGASQAGQVLGALGNIQAPAQSGDKDGGANTDNGRRGARGESTSGDVESSSGSLQDGQSSGATRSPDRSGAYAHRHDDASAEAASAFPGPSGDWSKCDLLRFLQSWNEAVDAFLVYGNVTHESVKLPSWLIRQRWMHHGGSSELTVESVTGMKRQIIVAFQAVCNCLAELLDDGEDTEASSNWFLLSSDKRLLRIRNSSVPEGAQRIVYRLDEDTFNQIAAILNKEAVLSTVTTSTQESGQVDDDDSYLSPAIEAELSLRKQQSVVVSRRSESPGRPRSSSGSSAPEPAATVHAEDQVPPPLQLPETPAGVEQHQATRKRSREWDQCGGGPNSDADGGSLATGTLEDISNYQEPERPRQRVRVRPRADNARQDDEKRILALLDSTQRDFDRLMSSLRAERVRERLKHHTFLRDVVAQRCNPPMNSARAVYLRELALQQSQQLLVNFMALHSEREHEREQQRRLLLSAVRGRLASRYLPPTS